MDTATSSAVATIGRVLVIEDDLEAADDLAERLGEAGWQVEQAPDGDRGLTLATERTYDALVVDRMLPDLDGLALVGELRARNVSAPVIFLTAMASVADRVAGLEGGGDDYLVKPFAFAELNARLNALVRRPPARHPEQTLLVVGELALDRLGRKALIGGEEIDLLPLEFRLLEVLMLNAGRVLTRAMLLEKVWGFRFDPRTNIVETHLSRLRAKIQRTGVAAPIVTVRGAGYMAEPTGGALGA
jgi:two-component system OmpR family response regulator